jgi:uncharacterized protein YjbI with pentapeptide repeats
LTAAEVRNRYERGGRDFSGLDIEDIGDVRSFRGAVLDGVNFSDCFILADFTKASLRGCRFRSANVKACSFDEADLRGCDFSGAAIDSATFLSAILDGAIFIGATAYSRTLKANEKPDW